MIFEVLTNEETKVARNEFIQIIKEVRELLSKKYKFIIKSVGSDKYNFNIKNSNGEYDLDYLMILTKNSESEYYPNDPTKIRNEIFQTFQDVVKRKKYQTYNTEESTSVITLIKMDEKKRIWSYDICITKEFSNNKDANMDNIVRNSSGNNNDGGNTYTWNQLGLINKGENWFEKLKSEKRKEIVNKIIEKKTESKKIGNKNDPKYKTTSQIFLEVYNENK